jgi:hypothetical protein
MTPGQLLELVNALSLTDATSLGAMIISELQLLYFAENASALPSLLSACGRRAACAVP